MAASSVKVDWDLADVWGAFGGAVKSRVLCQSKTHSLREDDQAVRSSVPFWVLGGSSDSREANFLARVSADRSAAPSARGPLAMHGNLG